MPLYITTIVGDGTDANYFQPAVWNNISGEGWIDLRPDATVNPGRGLLYLPTPQVDPRLDKLAELPDEVLSAGIRTRLGNALGLTLGQTSFREIAAELLTLHARTDGTRWRPLTATIQGVMELWLGGLGRFHAWRHGSVGASFTESWPTNGTTISSGQDQPWNEDSIDVEVSGTQLRLATLTTACFGRCITNLATDNHEHSASATIVLAALQARAGLMVRKIDSTAWTAYEILAGRTSPSSFTQRLRKVVNGAATNLSTNTTDAGASFSISCKANGSSISGVLGSTTHGPVTDTGITGNLQVGYTMWAQSTLGDSTLDTHTASDLVIAAAGRSKGLRTLALTGAGI